MPRYSLVFLALVGSVSLAAACGDSGSTSTSTGTGTGGSGSTTTTAGSGGAGGGTTTTTAGSGGAGGGTTTGGGPMNACTNAADAAILMMIDAAAIVGKCGQDNLGMEPATYDCIKAGTGLSDDCVTCFDGTVQCVVQKCLTECLSDPASQACKDCRATNCDPVFAACSGIMP